VECEQCLNICLEQCLQLGVVLLQSLCQLKCCDCITDHFLFSYPKGSELLRHSCHLWMFSHLRATPVVVGPLAMVPPRDRFLSPIPDGRES